MQYYVPTTFTNSFLRHLENINSNENHKITEVYGSLPVSPIGSARPPINLPNITIEDMANHISKLNRQGVMFSYLLNTPYNINCPQQEITNFINKIIELLGGNNSVTVGSKSLFEYVKKNFKIKIIISLVFDIKQEKDIEYFIDNGADNIVLSTTQNRNFQFLKKCVKKYNDKIILMANESCLFNCKDRLNHFTFASNQSLCNVSQQFFEDKYMSSCTFKKLTNLVELIKSSWIRPEDITRYEDIGIKHIKLADRTKPEKWLVHCFNHYISKKSPDNFFDILAITPDNLKKGDKNIVFPSVFIDSKKLTNFIDYFYTNNIDCLNLKCDQCLYCKKYAEDSIIVNKKELEKYLNTLCKQ